MNDNRESLSKHIDEAFVPVTLWAPSNDEASERVLSRPSLGGPQCRGGAVLHPLASSQEQKRGQAWQNTTQIGRMSPDVRCEVSPDVRVHHHCHRPTAQVHERCFEPPGLGRCLPGSENGHQQYPAVVGFGGHVMSCIYMHLLYIYIYIHVIIASDS